MKLLTAYDKNYAEMAALTSKAAYCERWGIEYIEARIPETYDRPPAWYKIRLLLSMMSGTGELLMWVDCDTLFMQEDRELDFSFVFDGGQQYIITAKDENGINTGVIIIADLPKYKELLLNAYSKTQYLNHVWWEQLAIRDAIQEFGVPFAEAGMLNANFYTSPQNYKPGDFIVHFAGVPNRLFAIKKWIKEHEFN